MKRVILAGYIGFGNCGDEAMLAGAIAWLRQHFAPEEILILSADPAASELEHGVGARRALPLGRGVVFKSLARPARWRTLAALWRADLVVWVAGSGIFSDARGSTIGQFWPLFRLLRALARHFIFLSASVGPIEHEASRRVIRRIAAHTDAFGLRDSESVALLRSLLGERPNIFSMADMALELAPEGLTRAQALWAEEGLPRDRPCVAFCPICFFQTPEQVPRARQYEEQFAATIARTLDALAASEGLQPVIVPFQRGYDHEIARRVAGQMRHQATILRGGYHPGEMLGLLARMRLVIGVRFHSLVLAAMAGTPLVPILYDDKSRGFIRDLGLEHLGVDYYCWRREHPPLDGERLLACARQALAEKETLHAQTQARLAAMRARNKNGAARLKEMGIE